MWKESEKVGLKLNSQETKIMASALINLWQIDGETVTDFIYLGSKIFAHGDCSHEIKNTLAPWKKSYDKARQHVRKQRHHFTDKRQSNKSYGFSSSHIRMWDLDHKEGRVLKNWCFWTVVLEKTLESPLDCKEIQPVHPKGDQSWVFTGRTDVWSWNSNTLAIWFKELTHLKRPWCWERLRARGEWDDRGWDDWMVSLTQWTWVCVNSGSWWWTGRLGVLQFMG